MATFLLWKVARPQAEYRLKQNRGFAAAAASFFLSDQKETKESPGDVAFGKDLRLAPWSFMSHFPPDPLFYGGSQRGAWAVASGAETSGRVPMLTHCRSAQLTKQVLLQDKVRLSSRTYTVGGGRRAGPLFVCRGRCLIGPRAATCGRPYEILHPFRGAFPSGEFHKGGRFPLSGGNVERSETKGVGTIRNPSPL